MEPAESKPRISVAFCVDEGFIPHLGAALASLFLSNASHDLEVFVATNQISAENQAGLDAVAQQFGRELRYLDVDLSRISHLREYFQPTSAYYRLLLCHMLPHHRQIIYLDSDIVIEADLDPLWKTDITEYGCAAFPEPEYHQQWLVPKYGLTGDLYVNSGVLLMNLDYWREHNISDKCLTWLKANEQLAVMMDQDAINTVLYKKKVFLDRKWNLNPIHGPVVELLKTYPQRIVHFAGAIKPWHKWYDFTLQKLYFRYLELTPWRGTVPMREPKSAGQCVSVANQYFEEDNFVQACNYYQQAINARLATQKFENLLLLRLINFGHELYNQKNYRLSADNYRACFEFWGFPLIHEDIYKIPDLTT